MASELKQFLKDVKHDDPVTNRQLRSGVNRREMLRRLSKLREEKGISQEQVAKQMGTAQGQIYRIEQGEELRLSTLERYAAVLGIVFEFDDKELGKVRLRPKNSVLPRHIPKQDRKTVKKSGKKVTKKRSPKSVKRAVKRVHLTGGKERTKHAKVRAA